ncbi:MAG: chromosome segregation protein SMC [Bacteroidota bacterium]
MQLQTLEIKGFKSFGEAAKLHFDAGITGVVGPNGCGKSNIVDSIRWVLGEQKTRNLRSDKMENVIFNGTKNRKPKQMAEVSLTFSNTKGVLPVEFSTVTITRRYYRTGESEYLLNGVTCRLRDITSLFLDTGIGPDSYAIIELKMVDDILSDRENSRRVLFEEAAGISRFKLRRKETYRKLEDTDKDLERVEDLLHEIQKNLKSLEKQARQAEEYFKIKEEYKQTSLLLARVVLHHKTAGRNRLQLQVQEAVELRDKLGQDLGLREAQTEKEKAEVLEREKLLQSRQKTLNAHTERILTFESEKKLKDERLRNLSERRSNLENQMKQDSVHSKRITEMLDSLRNDSDLLEKQSAETIAGLAEADKVWQALNAETKKIQEQSSGLNKSRSELQEKLFQVGKTLEINEIQLSSVKTELEKQQNQDSSQRSSISEMELRRQELAAKIALAGSKLQELLAAEAALQLAQDENGKQTEALKDKQSKLSREFDAKQNEYNLTKSLVESLEGFPEAIKFLKRNSPGMKHAPLLQDVLASPPEYRVALETFLEPYMNFYVADNDQQALDAIQLLGRSSKGRANFFLLDKFPPLQAELPLQVEGAIPASEVVECDDRFAPLVHALLHNVYITEGSNFPKADHLTFLSSAGNLIRKPDAIGGGSVGIFEGKRIGRAKNLEKLQNEIAALTLRIAEEKKKISDKQLELNQLKQSTKRSEIESARRDQDTLSREEAALRAKGEQLEGLLMRSGNRSKELEERMASLQKEITGGKPEVETRRVSLKEIDKQIADTAALLAQRNAAASAAYTEYNRLNMLKVQQQGTLSGKKQDIGYRDNELRGLTKRMQRSTEELAQAEADIIALHNTSTVKDDELPAMYAEKSEIEKGVSEAEKAWYASRGAIDLSEKEAREIMRRRENNETLIQELNRKITDERLALASVTERMAAEFGIDIEKQDRESETEFVLPNETEEDLRITSAKIKARLERLGTVNHLAMEAYNEMKERSDFIITQRKDLLDAKNLLVQTISEIDEVARTAFTDTFNRIRENFIHVFRSLFTNEDTCDLILNDPANPLESGIDIIAKPKGKRPLSISQLSGGEKTLTAISLLFAVYLIKPAPFCIFDEVDAPLDDANIDKFNNIIRKFSADSQFIIVTHNKRTMAGTEVIYGVTMQEQGISTLIPVDMRMAV